jgi:hypothetical protein
MKQAQGGSHLSAAIPSMTYSDNSSCSSGRNQKDSTTSNIALSTSRLSENIMRKIDRDPYEVYEHAKVLGTGSMVRHSSHSIMSSHSSV